MRRFVLMILLVSLVSSAANLTMDLSLKTSCPGNALSASSIGSDNAPAAGVELRLILYEPYYGLRAINHTDSNGNASFELKKPGAYRLYAYSKVYDYPDEFAQFNYSLCPPLPPKEMNLTLEKDCNRSMLKIQVSSNNTPLEDVQVSDGTWSSLSESDGVVIFPLAEGAVRIIASKDGFLNKTLEVMLTCKECLGDDDCPDDRACVNDNCTAVNGTCGYAANHAWVDYGCCEDSGCANGSICSNHTCIANPVPLPALPSNLTPNTTANGTTDKTGTTPGTCPLPAFLPLLLLAALASRDSVFNVSG